MARLRDFPRIVLSALLSVSLIVVPAWGSPAATLGTVISAERAHVGTAAATVGTTVFNGDQLNTEQLGRIQVRAAAARLLLSGASRVTWGGDQNTPAAALTAGTATFSTANSKAFALHIASAVIRPRDDEPTIGSVSVLGPKELTVRCSRGALTITVEDDTRVIPEGAAYRVVLDPDPKSVAEAATTDPWPQKQPKRPGQSRFLWFVIGVTGVVTYFAVSEALESPDRP
jgi:hypothetical protein